MPAPKAGGVRPPTARLFPALPLPLSWLTSGCQSAMSLWACSELFPAAGADEGAAFELVIAAAKRQLVTHFGDAMRVLASPGLLVSRGGVGEARGAAQPHKQPCEVVLSWLHGQRLGSAGLVGHPRSERGRGAADARGAVQGEYLSLPARGVEALLEVRAGCRDIAEDAQAGISAALPPCLHGQKRPARPPHFHSRRRASGRVVLTPVGPYGLSRNQAG